MSIRLLEAHTFDTELVRLSPRFVLLEPVEDK